MNDKTLGYLIVGFSVLIMIVYFAWFFAPALGSTLAWLVPYAAWAYKLPILLAVYVVLFIVLWIGYTMATTPPPIPLDNPLDLEKIEDEAEDKEK